MSFLQQRNLLPPILAAISFHARTKRGHFHHIWFILAPELSFVHLYFFKMRSPFYPFPENTCSSALEDFAPYVGFGGGCGVLNRGGVFGPSMLPEGGAWPPCRERKGSQSNAVSHRAWEYLGVQDTGFRNVPDGGGLYCVKNELLNGRVPSAPGTTVIPLLVHLENEDPRGASEFSKNVWWRHENNLMAFFWKTCLRF